MLDSLPRVSQAHLVGQPIQALDTPALLINVPVMDRNIARMAETFRAAGINWRPHTKGLKSPALVERLLAAGAIGITCAKTSEAEVMAEAGVRDILIANQVVGEAKIARLLRVRTLADPIVAVDSPPNVAELEAAAQAVGTTLRVVVEVDTGMQRAGTAPGQPAVELAKRVAQSPSLRFAGVMGWEGHATPIAEGGEKERRIAHAVGLLTSTADACRAAGLPVEIVSCGGTGTYWVTAHLPGVTEVQAGGGILSDVVYREKMGVDHEPAATILATVTSRPTPTRIICDAGKKTMSSDGAVPQPVLNTPVQRVGLSAEHATIELQVPSTSPQVGDKIEFIVGYTDTTVHLHEELYAVRDGRVEAVWPVVGRGKLR
ncbi:MAG: DSD1 family PLP-dependent enzyme [Chloroflexota bacterium]|nr:DSD1 family PLP-dependent enzyme [Chloroflexota bacterium]